MYTSMKRRLFLKGSIAASTLGVAAGAGLLTPQAVLAAWNQNAFTANDLNGAMTGTFGSSASEASDKVKIKAPDIAENGAVVPVSISTDIEKIESIALFAEQNATPLSAVFHLHGSARGQVSTRIKMGKTGDVVAVVKADGKLYAARKSVKVTVGGCGG